jgi:hypothetical protein
MQVFLSHVAEDGPLARELAAQLAESGLQVWDPEREILPGDSWAKGVSEALETSDAMVVLFSPEYARSSYARSEVEYALGNPRYRNRLVPVVVGSPDEIPWVFKKFQTISYRGDATQVAEQIEAALLSAAPA